MLNLTNLVLVISMLNLINLVLVIPVLNLINLVKFKKDTAEKFRAFNL